MAEEVTIKDFEKEWKRRQEEEKKKQKVEKVTTWVEDHKELTAILIPAGITLLTLLAKGSVNIAKGAIRNANLRKEQQLKELYCYDRSLGHYWKLKRKLTNDEWTSIERRKRNGETLASILSELKVLA